MKRWILIVLLAGSIARSEGTPNGTNGPVFASAVASNGTVYFGGAFSWMGDTHCGSIFAWDGERVSTLGGGLHQGPKDSDEVGTVRALHVADGMLYAGGTFSRAGSNVTVRNIARYDLTAKKWSALGTGCDGAVHAILDRSDQLYVGGEFTTCGGKQGRGLGRYANGSWTSVPGWSADKGAKVNALATRSDRLYVGGDFRVDGIDWNFAEYDCSTNKWATETYKYSEPITGLAGSPTGLLCVGGFDSVNGKAAQGVAHYDGRSWTACPGLEKYILSDSLSCSYSPATKSYYVADSAGAAVQIQERSGNVNGLCTGCVDRSFNTVAATADAVYLGADKPVQLPNGETAHHIVVEKNGKVEALKGR